MQKEIWTNEYAKAKNLPSSNTMIPSRTLVEFIETEKLLYSGKALDIGSGKGRNSIYLAQHGFEVIGVEFVTKAIEEAKIEVEKLNLSNKVSFHEQSIGEKMPFQDESIDLIIDMMVMHSLSKEEREIYISEVQRVLKPHGYFVFHTLAADSPAAQELFKQSPGPEENSYIISQNGAVEKAFTEEDFNQMFTDLKTFKLNTKTQSTAAFGRVYERTYLHGILQKYRNNSNNLL